MGAYGTGIALKGVVATLTLTIIILSIVFMAAAVSAPTGRTVSDAVTFESLCGNASADALRAGLGFAPSLAVGAVASVSFESLCGSAVVDSLRAGLGI